METVKKDINRRELTPIERGVRNSVVWRLSTAGFNVSTISNVMNMTQSTVSRVIEKKPDSGKLIDSILWGKGGE